MLRASNIAKKVLAAKRKFWVSFEVRVDPDDKGDGRPLTSEDFRTLEKVQTKLNKLFAPDKVWGELYRGAGVKLESSGEFDGNDYFTIGSFTRPVMDLPALAKVIDKHEITVDDGVMELEDIDGHEVTVSGFQATDGSGGLVLYRDWDTLGVEM